MPLVPPDLNEQVLDETEDGGSEQKGKTVKKDKKETIKVADLYGEIKQIVKATKAFEEHGEMVLVDNDKITKAKNELQNLLRENHLVGVGGNEEQLKALIDYTDRQYMKQLVESSRFVGNGSVMDSLKEANLKGEAGRAKYLLDDELAGPSYSEDLSEQRKEWYDATKKKVEQRLHSTLVDGEGTLTEVKQQISEWADQVPSTDKADNKAQ